MENQHSEEDLKNIARQLACPEGEHGIKTGEMMNLSNIGMTYAAVSALNLKDGESILEIGHGNGGHIAHLLSQANNLKYVGADISETIIAEAQNINASFVEKGGVRFQLTDGIHLPFADERFDKIFTVNTVYFWKNPLEYLKEIKNILKGNGLFVIVFADRTFMEKLPFTKYGFTLYGLEDVKNLLIKAGLAVAHTAKKTEQIKSSAGFMVERDYHVVSATLI